MNSVFNPRRFLRLFRKHTAEHIRIYLMALLVLLGVLVVGGSFITYVMNEPLNARVQFTLYFQTLLLSGTVFTSTIFSDFGEKTKAIPSLTLPATHFEKFLVAWIYSYVIFLLVYTASFYLILCFLVYGKTFPGVHKELFSIFDLRTGYTLIIFSFLQAIILYGSIYYKSLHFIKTGFAFFLPLAFFVILNRLFFSVLLTRPVTVSAPFSDVSFVENGRDISINIGDRTQPYIFLIVGVVTLIIWTAAFYRLKEKEV